MRVLIDNSGYHLRNMGDVAMLQVGVERIREMYPDADISVVTTDPALCRRYVNAAPVDPGARQRWAHSQVFPLVVPRSRIPYRVQKWIVRRECEFKNRFPRLAASFIGSGGGRVSGDVAGAGQFVKEIDACDAVIVTGGGFFTDAFLGHAGAVLSTLELAHRLGKPTAVFGQGLGPLSCAATIARMGRVFSRVKVLGLREQVGGGRILERAGVVWSNVICTGDDAIERAYGLRAKELGDAIGINVRVAQYSRLGQEARNCVGLAIQNVTRSIGALLQPVPISFLETESDSDRIIEMVSAISCPLEQIPTDCPDEVAKAVSRCRVVVTGSYHAGVFALSQGIPVVGLVSCEYYADKFRGLASQFGCGCSVVMMDSPNATELITLAIDEAYRAAPGMREQLLCSARRQIASSRGAYAQAFAGL